MDLEARRLSLARLLRRLRNLRRSHGGDSPPVVSQLALILSARRVYKRANKASKRQTWNRLLRENADTPWNFVTKIAFKKVRPDHVCPSLTSSDPALNGSLCPDIVATVDRFLSTLFLRASSAPNVSWPDDTPQRPLEPPFTLNELLAAAKCIKPRKAPGVDGICADTVRHALFGNSTAALSLFNACLSVGHFPSPWKQGSLCLLLKDPDLPPDSVKFYRLITLLPIVSKTLERLIKGRLCTHLSGPKFFTNCQYGFLPGRSAVDALMVVKQFAAASHRKYVMAISINISAAFDNLSWSSLLRRLRLANLPDSLYQLIVSYLIGRQVTVRGETFEWITTLERGCLQGSVLGPVFWNTTNELLIVLADLKKAFIVAYADDLLLLVEGDSRLTLEQNAKECLDSIQTRTALNGLSLAAHKSACILLKGILSSSRPPHLKLGEFVIPYVQTIKYLGILIGERFSLDEHVKFMRNKLTKTFAALARTIRFQWGLSDSALARIYDSIFLPSVCYAAPFWAFSVRKANILAHLPCSVSCFCAYRPSAQPPPRMLSGH